MSFQPHLIFYVGDDAAIFGFVRGVSSTFRLEDENKILDELLEIGNLLPDFEGTDVIEPM